MRWKTHADVRCVKRRHDPLHLFSEVQQASLMHADNQTSPKRRFHNNCIASESNGHSPCQNATPAKYLFTSSAGMRYSCHSSSTSGS